MLNPNRDEAKRHFVFASRHLLLSMAFASVFHHLASIRLLSQGVGEPDALSWSHGEILPGIPISGFLEVFRFENDALHRGILERLDGDVKPWFSKNTDAPIGVRPRMKRGAVTGWTSATGEDLNNVSGGADHCAFAFLSMGSSAFKVFAGRRSVSPLVVFEKSAHSEGL